MVVVVVEVEEEATNIKETEQLHAVGQHSHRLMQLMVVVVVVVVALQGLF